MCVCVWFKHSNWGAEQQRAMSCWLTDGSWWHFHNEINCATNQLIFKWSSIDCKEVTRAFSGSSLCPHCLPKISRLHEMKPLKSICAKLNLYSLSSPSRVLLGINTGKIQLSTNTEVARCVSVQLNITNTQALFRMNAFMVRWGIHLSLSLLYLSVD